MVVTRLVAVGAALAAFTIVSVAPAAYADSGNSDSNSNGKSNGNGNFLRVDPSRARGGQTVKLEARCDSNKVDLAVSAALTDVREWVRSNREDIDIETTAKVRNDVRSGDFDVSFHCGNQKISVKITVDNGDGRGGGTTTTRPTSTSTTTETTTTTVDATTTSMVYPSGAPQTGGAGPDDTDSGMLMLAELGGVALVAGAGVVFAVNRRRRLAGQHG